MTLIEEDSEVREAVEVIVGKVGSKGQADPQRLSTLVEREVGDIGMAFYDALDEAEDAGLVEGQEDMGTSHTSYVATEDGVEAAEYVAEHGELPPEYTGGLEDEMAVDGGTDPQYEILQDTFEEVDDMLSEGSSENAETIVELNYGEGTMERDLLEAYIEQNS